MKRMKVVIPILCAILLLVVVTVIYESRRVTDVAATAETTTAPEHAVIATTSATSHVPEIVPAVNVADVPGWNATSTKLKGVRVEFLYPDGFKYNHTCSSPRYIGDCVIYTLSDQALARGSVEVSVENRDKEEYAMVIAGYSEPSTLNEFRKLDVRGSVHFDAFQSVGPGFGRGEIYQSLEFYYYDGKKEYTVTCNQCAPDFAARFVRSVKIFSPNSSSPVTIDSWN